VNQTPRRGLGTKAKRTTLACLAILGFAVAAHASAWGEALVEFVLGKHDRQDAEASVDAAFVSKSIAICPAPTPPPPVPPPTAAQMIPIITDIILSNDAPTVSVSAAPAFAVAPATITLSAAAADSDGIVTKVEFYQNGALIPGCTDTAAPYTCSWSVSTPNRYEVTAKAFDSEGDLTLSSQAIVAVSTANNTPPVVSVSAAPLTGLLSPETVTITASASDANGIALVEFYDGDTLLGIDSQAPFQFAKALTAGDHNLRARAFDAGFVTAWSGAVAVSVAPNIPPSVELRIEPQTSLIANATLRLVATPTDTTGSVARVEIHRAGAAIASHDNSGVLQAVVAALGNGEHRFKARAIDVKGLIGESAEMCVKVAVRPTATLAANATLPNAPGRIRASATLVDPDRAVRTVRFYVRNASGTIVRDSSIPRPAVDPEGGYAPAVEWEGFDAGAYTIHGEILDGSLPAQRIADLNSVSVPIGAGTAPHIAQLQRPAMPSATPSAVTQWGETFSPGQLLTLRATAADSEADLARVEYTLENELLTPLSSWTVNATSGGQATPFAMEVPVVAGNVSSRVRFIRAVAFDSTGLGSAPVRAPIAIIGSGATSLPCSAPTEFQDTGNVCSSTQNVAHEVRVPPYGQLNSRIEAERYDLGGQGVGYFEIDGPSADPGNARRADDVEVGCYQLDGPDEDNLPGDGDHSCWLGATRDGEWLRYTINVTSASAYWVCAKLSDVGLNRLGLRDGFPLPESAPIEIDGLQTPVSMPLLSDGFEDATARAAPTAHAKSGACPTGYSVLDKTPYLPTGAYKMRIAWSANSPAPIEWIEFAPKPPDGNAPIVSFSSPAPSLGPAGNPTSAQYPLGVSIPLVVDVKTAPNVVNREVRFYVDGAWRHTDAIAPFEWTWPDATAGIRALRADLHIDQNAVPAATAYMNVPVGAPANNPATVRFVSPAPSSTPIAATAGTPVALHVHAADDEGAAIAPTLWRATNGAGAVEIPASELATLPPMAAATHAWTWTPGTGTHVLTARASDPVQSTPTISAPVTFAVGTATQPPPGAIASEPTPIVKPVPTADHDSEKVGALGAQFRVNETGNATYSIPLWVAPGAAGTQPKLTLAYNSGSGDGTLGVGWSLEATSAITRCRTSKESGDAGPHHPTVLFPGSDGVERDQYCLNGQRLILVGGTHGTAGAEYRTELDSMARIRIVDLTDVTGVAGAEAFVVDGKDGTATTFGGSKIRKYNATADSDSNARLMANRASPVGSVAAGSAVMVWAQSRVEDTLGNHIDFLYNASGTTGEQVLEEIHYTGSTTVAGAVPRSYIDLLYTPRSAPAVSYISGMKLQQSNLLSAVAVFNNGHEVRKYHLGYETAPATYKQRLVSVQECAKTDPTAPEGGSSPVVCTPQTRFTWSNGAFGVSGETIDRFSDGTLAGIDKLVDADAIKYGDVNGDGRTDLVWVQDHRICVSTAGSAGFSYTTVCPSTVNNGPADSSEIKLFIRDYCPPPSGECTKAAPALAYHLFDFDGDGRDDLLVAEDDRTTWSIIRSDGSGKPYLPAGRVDTGISIAGIGEGHFVDVDGDGLPDLINHHEASGSSSGTGGVIEQPGCTRSCPQPNTPIQRAWNTPIEAILPVAYRMARNGKPFEDVPSVACGMPSGSTTPLPYCFARRGTDPKALGDILKFVGLDSPSHLDENTRLCVNPNLVDGRLTLPLDGRSEPFDLNGDGRSDLRVRFRLPVWNGTQCNSAPKANWYGVLENTGYESNRWTFALRLTKAIGSEIAGGVHASDPRDDHRLQLADLNGDSLADLFYREQVDVDPGAGTTIVPKWYYQLNLGYAELGAARFTAQTEITGIVTTGKIERTVAVADIDSDGRADLLYGIDGPTNREWWYRRWDGAGFAGAVVLPNVTSTVGENSERSSFVDLDGDGRAEQVVHDRDENQQSEQVTMRRSPAAGRYKPVDAITTITNGLGAQTIIDYAPLTLSTVYMPGKDTATTTFGRGSPTFDLRSPMYVVRTAKSSAPKWDNAGYLARVDYRYRGARMQAGGRGFLGFEEVQSIDAHNYIETTTQYSQNFPYIGRPKRTVSRVLSSTSNWYVDATRTLHCVDPDTFGCYAYISPVNRAWLPPDPLSALHDATSTFSAVAYAAGVGYPTEITPATSSALPTSPAPVLVFQTLASVEERELNSPSSVTYKESTAFSKYDRYGNLTRSTTTRLDSSDTVVKTVDTTQTYLDAPTTDDWFLGRLATSRVETALPGSGQANVVRQTGFAYRLGQNGDPNDGLLAAEIVMPNDARAGYSLITAYDYDARGNRTKVATCDAASVGHDWRVCRATVPGDLDFAPVDRHTVRRLAESSFDTDGRYPLQSLEVFDDGDGRASASTAVSTIDTRDHVGNVTQATSAHGVVSDARFGALGKQQFARDNTGAAAETIVRYCTGNAPTAWGQTSAAATASCPAGLGVKYGVESKTHGGTSSYAYFDLLGREVASYAASFQANQFSRVVTTYDEMGRVRTKSVPCLATGNTGICTEPGTTTYGYDELGRPELVVYPDASETQTDYGALTLTTRLAANKHNVRQAKREVRNAIGEIVKVSEIAFNAGGVEVQSGATVCYRYAPTGQMVRAVKRSADFTCSDANESGAIVTSMVYDALGRKQSMSDADKGAWTYTYNAAGEAIQENGPRGCTRSYHDARGRLYKREDFSDSACTARQHTSLWRFDFATREPVASNLKAFGAAANENVLFGSETAPRQTKSWTYDKFGRLRSATTTLDQRTYTERNTYDVHGRPFQSLMASPEFTGESGVQYAYTTRGFLDRVLDAQGATTEYYKVLEMDAFGHVKREQHAPGILTTRGYDDKLGRLLTITSSSGGVNRQDWTYQWDPIGNLSTRRSAKAGITEIYSYDELNRLLTGSNGESSTYDAIGNLTARTVPGVTRAHNYGVPAATESHRAQWLSDCQGYTTTAGPHAATRVGSVNYCYDAAGNQVRARGTETRDIAYSVADQATWITATMSGVGQSSSTRFTYGANHERIKREDWRSIVADTDQNPLVTTHYVGSAEIVLKSKGVCSPAPYADVTVRRNFGSLILTQRRKFDGACNATDAVRRDYRLVDHLGSTDAILGHDGAPSANDAQSTAASEQAWSAWGERRQATTLAFLSNSSLYNFDDQLTRKGYTGHEQIDLSGLIHMNGRVYDPRIARFIQADPVVQEPFYPQSLNRYTYVFNNPLNHTDPSGYSARPKWISWAMLAVSIYITVQSAGTTNALMSMNSAFAGSGFAAEAAFVAVGSGFASGVAATGSITAGVQGAFTALAFMGVGQFADGLNLAENGLARAAAHGVAGGVIEDLSGGNFGHGFAQAGVSKILSANLNHPDPAVDGVLAAIVGGTMSEIGGGKFASGAVTGALQWAFNENLSRPSRWIDLEDGWEARLDTTPGAEVTRDNYEFHLYKDGRERKHQRGHFRLGKFFGKHGLPSDRPGGLGYRQYNILKGEEIDFLRRANLFPGKGNANIKGEDYGRWYGRAAKRAIKAMGVVGAVVTAYDLSQGRVGDVIQDATMSSETAKWNDLPNEYLEPSE